MRPLRGNHFLYGQAGCLSFSRSIILYFSLSLAFANSVFISLSLYLSGSWWDSARQHFYAATCGGHGSLFVESQIALLPSWFKPMSLPHPLFVFDSPKSIRSCSFQLALTSFVRYSLLYFTRTYQLLPWLRYYLFYSPFSLVLPFTINLFS